MATYYVRTDGSNANAGTGQPAGQAWATVAYALTSASGFASGDTLYVAPGIYTTQISVTMANPTVETNIIGDPTCTVFTGVTAGPVVITNYNSTLSGSGYSGNIITATTKNYLHFQNIQFKVDNNRVMFMTTCTNLKLTKCSFVAKHINNDIIYLTSPTSTAVNFTINKCVFFGANQHLNITGQNVADSSTIIDSIFIRAYNASAFLNSVQIAYYNCTIIGCTYGILAQPGSVTFPTTVQNCLLGSNIIDLICVTVANTIVENYNRLLGSNSRQNVVDNGTSSTVGDNGLDIFETLLQGLTNVQPFTSYLSSPNTNFGNSTGAPAADIYGVTWTGAKPDAGAGTYRVISSVGSYLPTERNASAITIAPGSTSQSIELYLGATGLAFNTSGLAAYYVRNQSAPVAITLVTQTATGAWSSGGFAEISSSLVPGVYRLDVPNAAFAAGASDVTIVVRGASGTNGAVLTVTLSSGGLTAAQTAAAVWDAATASYVTASSMGARVLKTTVDNRPADVGTSFHIQSNVHAIVDSTAAADELKGALLHNGTDYISADLLTPVSAATSVHIGPYQLLADGLGADQPLDVNVGTATSIDVQVTDANGTGIDITGATVTAKVYSSAGTLVASYAGTATYADNGRLSFGLTTTVTNTSGTYTVTVTRTTGATDTQIFGPLRLYVRPV
jgi:hypothetical protein